MIIGIAAANVIRGLRQMARAANYAYNLTISVSEAMVHTGFCAQQLQIKPTDRSTRCQFWRQEDGIALASALNYVCGNP